MPTGLHPAPSRNQLVSFDKAGICCSRGHLPPSAAYRPFIRSPIRARRRATGRAAISVRSTVPNTGAIAPVLLDLLYKKAIVTLDESRGRSRHGIPHYYEDARGYEASQIIARALQK